MSRTTTIIGPADHGRPMTLDEFELAEGVEGHLYELGRGAIVVTDVPNTPHMRQVEELRDQLVGYKLAHKGVVYSVAAGGDAKILVADKQSERHPQTCSSTRPRRPQPTCGPPGFPRSSSKSSRPAPPS